MLVRRFAWRDHDEHGWGWVPTFIEGADPTSGMGAAHDCLEHFPRCIGGFEGEMMAFGAMHFVRETYLFPGYRSNIYDVAKNELAWFLRAVMAGEQTLKDPGPVRGTSSYMDIERRRRTIRDAIMLALQEDRNGEYGNLAVARRLLPQRADERILGWMLKGAIKAEKRFARWDLKGWQVTELFERIQGQFDAARKGDPDDIEDAETITVRVNFAERTVVTTRANEQGEQSVFDG